MKPWKVQKFFGDVVYDLRNRGLLPVVILLLVAMVAVPVLISRGGSGSSSSSLQPSSAAAGPAPETQSAVLAYNPGVRNYKQRLDDLTSKNPFRQEFSQSAGAAASQLNSTVSTATSTGTGSSSSSSTSSSTGTPTESTGGSTESKKKKKSSKTTYSYSVNVLAGDVTTTLTPFNNVAAITPLPSQTTTVVVYYGLSSDNKQALFLVSNKVDALSGPGTCVPAPDDCSLLSLAPGQAEDLHYSKDGKTYRIVVAEIKRVAK